MNLDIGTQLGDYRILARIGKGAYGMVFEAEHVITRRVDAVKLMLDAGPGAAEEEQRFLREIQVQASLQHPNIAAVYTAFRTPWGLALAMERVQGQPLSAILLQGRPPLSQAVGYILATLAALSCGESHGIVHRDIKPDNILITPEGTVKITDFGLAQVRGCPRITTSGESLGTPCYMSPEQVIATEDVDARTDVYSTGVVLYEAVTGRPPFTGTNGFAVMLAQRETPPVPPIELEPTIPPQLSQVILRALAKNPALRYQTAAEFHQALEVAMAPTRATVVEAARIKRARRSWPGLKPAAAAAGAALCLCGLMAWGARLAKPAHRTAAHTIPPRKTTPAAVAALPAERPVSEAVSGPEPEPPPAATVPVRTTRPKPWRAESMTRPPIPPPTFTTAPAPEPEPESEAPRAAAEAVKTPVARLPEPILEEPPVKAPEATPAEAPEAAAPVAVGRRPNVFKRAVTRIFGRK